MLLEDLFLGFVFSKLFGKGETQTQSPAVVFPPNGHAAPTTTTPATTTAPPAQPQFPAQVPVPQTAPPAPTTAAAPQGTPAPPGFKRAVEMWIVQPKLAQQGAAAISGMGPQVGAMALSALQAQFPKGWQRATSATAAEQAFAKSLLPQWHDGKVIFGGGQTLPAARAFQFTKHPAGTAPQAPASSPAPSQASFPTAVTVPAAAPAGVPAPPTVPPPAVPVVTRTPGGGTVTTLPEVLITADRGAAAQAGPQVTLVRRGEGLANVAKRLGQPATATSAIVLQKANLPGPNGNYTAQALDKGGLKKKGRAGGLQPGDPLFVPPTWSPVDPARL